MDQYVIVISPTLCIVLSNNESLTSLWSLFLFLICNKIIKKANVMQKNIDILKRTNRINIAVAENE